MSPVGQITNNVSNTVLVKTRAPSIDENITQGAWKALMIGQWEGWGPGKNENPKNITVNTQVQLNMPSFTIYRPLGYYWDHHGNGWGHPRAQKDAGPRHGQPGNLHGYWESPGYSAGSFDGPAGGCLSIAHPDIGYRGFGWSWEYLLVMKFAFDEALDYNSYSLVWQWNNTQVGRSIGKTYHGSAQGENMKLETVQIDSIGELLEENTAKPTEGLTYPLKFSKNWFDHDAAGNSNCCCWGGWQSTHGYLTMAAKAYKAKDGFVIKMQVSDSDKWLFEEGRQFMVGII
jgi:hypothetical protein